MRTFPPTPDRAGMPNTPGRRFSRTEAVAKLNCGRAQTRLAISVAMAQPQPNTGLTCLLMAWKGFSPVDSVT